MEYKRMKELAAEYSIHRSSVCRIIQEIESCGRYPANAVIGGGIRLVDADVFQDYMENRALLKHPNNRKYVKKYEVTSHE